MFVCLTTVKKLMMSINWCKNSHLLCSDKHTFRAASSNDFAFCASQKWAKTRITNKMNFIVPKSTHRSSILELYIRFQDHFVIYFVSSARKTDVQMTGKIMDTLLGIKHCPPNFNVCTCVSFDIKWFFASQTGECFRWIVDVN